jgi:hypothetical protein
MLGAFINAGIQGAMGNLNSMGDFALALGIGGLSGAAGASVGAGIGSVLMGGNFMAGATGACMVNGLGFTGGAAMGAAGGGIGSFISGAGNSWAGGSNFANGLNDGLNAAKWGAISGAAIGGVSTGFHAVSETRNFWSGKPQVSGRKLYSFKNGSPRYNTTVSENRGYHCMRNYNSGTNINHYSDVNKWMEAMIEYNNIVRGNTNLPTSRNIDVSKFLGPAIVSTDANLGPNEWVTYVVDGKMLRTFTGDPGNYSDVITLIPPNSKTLTVTYNGTFGNVAK